MAIGVAFLVGLICLYIGFVVGVLIDEWTSDDDDDDDGGSPWPDYPPDDLLQIGGMMPRD